VDGIKPFHLLVLAINDPSGDRQSEKPDFSYVKAIFQVVLTFQTILLLNYSLFYLHLTSIAKKYRQIGF